MKSEQQYIDLYNHYSDMLCRGSHQVLNDCRAKALGTLSSNGLPCRNDERYRYTDVQGAFAPDYGLNLNRLRLNYDPRVAYRCAVRNLNSQLLYVVNDMPVGNELPINEPDLFVGTMCDFGQLYPERLRSYYNTLASNDDINAVNTLLCQDGVVIWLGEGRKLNNPIQIVNLSISNVQMMSNRRLLVVLEKGAELSLLNCEHSATKATNLVTEVAEIILHEDSRLQFYNIEETHSNNTLFASTNIRQMERSAFEYASITLHNGLTRHTVDLAIDGDKAYAQLSGLTIADGAQHVDDSLLITHDAQESNSDVLYKYVLDGDSVGAFAGKVLVKPNAQKTASQQTNANLCLSPHAHMYTQPMLEIYADDVKCNHGSTVGQLDEQSLFYMAQRGISLEEGRRLLQQAFAMEVVNRIQMVPLRQRLTRMVEDRFRLGVSSCGDCSMCSTNMNK